MLATEATPSRSAVSSGTVPAPIIFAPPVRLRSPAWERAGARHAPLRPRRSPDQPGSRLTAAAVRRQVIDSINAGALDLDGGNALLKALHLKPVKGGGRVTFRVDVSIRAAYDGPAATFRHAQATAADELRTLRWTAFDGCPEGFGIDEPVAEGSHGRLYSTVHTTLRLAVDVPAYEEHLLEATARDLLLADLAGLCHVRPKPNPVTRWDADVTGWDEYAAGDDPDDEAWASAELADAVWADAARAGGAWADHPEDEFRETAGWAAEPALG